MAKCWAVCEEDMEGNLHMLMIYLSRSAAVAEAAKDPRFSVHPATVSLKRTQPTKKRAAKAEPNLKKAFEILLPSDDQKPDTPSNVP